MQDGQFPQIQLPVPILLVSRSCLCVPSVRPATTLTVCPLGQVVQKARRYVSHAAALVLVLPLKESSSPVSPTPVSFPLPSSTPASSQASSADYKDLLFSCRGQRPVGRQHESRQTKFPIQAVRLLMLYISSGNACPALFDTGPFSRDRVVGSKVAAKSGPLAALEPQRRGRHGLADG